MKCLEALGEPRQYASSELANTREEMVRLLSERRRQALGLDMPGEESRPSPLKRSRTASGILETMGHKTSQVQFFVKCRIPAWNVPHTVLEANALIRKLKGGELDDADDDEELKDALVHRTTLSRHALLLDSALDAHLANRIARMREEGTFLGLGFASDESPPSQVRFKGLRFQVTLVYLPTIPELATWENRIYDERPPLHRESFVLDIAHCPSKHGQAVLNVLRMQFARIGAYSMDLLVGTGDGGGENEGRRGIHATLEEEIPGYIRKRCMGHLSWNVAAALLAAMPDVEKDVKLIAAYLGDGITWSRLRGLATRSRADGGLGLMDPLGAAALEFFKEACTAVVDGRPESVYNILRFLGPREVVLRQGVGRDLEERNLGQDARAALAALESPHGRARRAVARELMRRCLWMHWHNLKHPHILEKTTFQRLIDTWSAKVTATEINDEVLEHLRMERAEVDALPRPPTTWMDLVVHQTIGSGHAFNAAWQDLRECHLVTSAQAVSHLKLATSNIHRSAWILGGVICPYAEVAVESANDFVRHLDTTSPQARTHFERCFCDTQGIHQ